VEVFNVFDGATDWEHDQPGFRSAGVVVGEVVGAAAIGGTVYVLAAGERLFPYHFHHGNEEWLLVLEGAPTLREPGGERTLARGDVVCFPPGAEGAHQLRNDGGEPVRMLMLSTRLRPEIVEYPDSGKIGIRAAGADYNVARGPELEYWEGES
jgi:uncharacterized cupin superfamily protein